MCSIFSLTLAQAKLLAWKAQFSDSVALLHFLPGRLLDFHLCFWYFLSCQVPNAPSLAGLGMESLPMLLWLPSHPFILPFTVLCHRCIYICLNPSIRFLSERAVMSPSCLLKYPQILALSVENNTEFKKQQQQQKLGKPFHFAIKICSCLLPSDFLHISTQAVPPAVRTLGLWSENCSVFCEATAYLLGSHGLVGKRQITQAV